MIYLDNAATSFYKPESVKRTLVRAVNTLTANPGRSSHYPSQKVAEIIYDTREKIKEFFRAYDYNVVFTKNCTEALNLAIFGTLKSGDHVITTIYEHNSVLRPLEALKSRGVEVTILDCDLESVADNIECEIRPNTRLIITTSVSNVTGGKCDINGVGEIANSHHILYLVDGAQGAGHIDIDMTTSRIDMLAFAGHKGLLSMTGVGGLIIKNGIKLNPILFGGTGTDSESLIQPDNIPEGLEAGTIPALPIISLNAGVDFLSKNFEIIKKIEQNTSIYLYNQLKKLDFVEIYSNECANNVFSFNIKNLDSTFVADCLNEEFNICVRAGLHCAPLIHKHLGTLTRGAVRVSIDFNNTTVEIDYLIHALKVIALRESRHEFTDDRE